MNDWLSIMMEMIGGRRFAFLPTLRLHPGVWRVKIEGLVYEISIGGVAQILRTRVVSACGLGCVKKFQ
jgi:hypothetical protein